MAEGSEKQEAPLYPITELAKPQSCRIGTR
jgi:hypothetical protein